MPCAGKLMNSQFNLLHKTKNIRKNKKEPKIKKKNDLLRGYGTGNKYPKLDCPAGT